MESEIVAISGEIEVLQNNYGNGDDVILKYRTGATPNACNEAEWEDYLASFVALGYVQIRLESTLQ